MKVELLVDPQNQEKGAEQPPHEGEARLSVGAKPVPAAKDPSNQIESSYSPSESSRIAEIVRRHEFHARNLTPRDGLVWDLVTEPS